ncbi:hypothetical protein FBU31_008129 [Coemansia sp. 'formosensis']|nr:hypothetical protein FBU31_008129 [Coemansia sp. 'formosensis']
MVDGPITISKKPTKGTLAFGQYLFRDFFTNINLRNGASSGGSDKGEKSKRVEPHGNV